MPKIVAKAVEEYRRVRFLQETSAAYAASRASRMSGPSVMLGFTGRGWPSALLLVI